MNRIITCLCFDYQAMEAAEYYTSLFSEGSIGPVVYHDAEGRLPKDSVLTADFVIAGQTFIALNSGADFKFTPAISFFVDCATEEELTTLWEKLTDGGQILMGLDKYPFSDKFGWTNDKFGVSWQLSLSHQKQKITPYFLFANDQHGRFEEAIKLYTNTFQNSKIEEIQYHPEGGIEPKGSVLQAFFKLNGQAFRGMDSAHNHGFTFTEAVSFYVICESQEESDTFWEILTATGGKESVCGWLKDPYGVSWQIVPDCLETMLQDSDQNKVNAVMQEVMKMKKPVIKPLVEAFNKN